ncbi:MAG: replication initiator protein [Microvirus sp.]|nr:MAG: replication initiator protein [Microvirus sp.]
MACHFPTPALHDPTAGTITLWPPVGTANEQLPCGSCSGCKTDRALEWSRRAQHEASAWTHNTFLTLTYNEENCPRELLPHHLQGFIKRLRQRHHRRDPGLATDIGQLRYLGCGEYGDQNKRPHYHLCLFNCGFHDAYRVAKDLYESPTVAAIWKYGSHKIGTLTGASANYVAQYTLKKVGDKSYCDADGVVLQAPFMRASLRPIIGANWIKKYYRDVRNGFLVYDDATPGRIPRAYMTYLEKHYPQLAEESKLASDKIREQRIKQRRANGADAYPPLRGGAKPTDDLAIERAKAHQQQQDEQARLLANGDTIRRNQINATRRKAQ